MSVRADGPKPDMEKIGKTEVNSVGSEFVLPLKIATLFILKIITEMPELAQADGRKLTAGLNGVKAERINIRECVVFVIKKIEPFPIEYLYGQKNSVNHKFDQKIFYNNIK